MSEIEIQFFGQSGSVDFLSPGSFSVTKNVSCARYISDFIFPILLHYPYNIPNSVFSREKSAEYFYIFFHICTS